MELREPGVGETRSPELLKYTPEQQTEAGSALPVGRL